ncbi:hypothetical protein CMEL01_01208 [Colletotrichum melonis]|uniref:Uncharacterized protein n=3 Tax=Colletotrichum acutatum species complex TaxID=2707335 RepID=A0AAI9YWD2_9PEZI|nr:uncharacterized protein CCOS01_08700 [Colletotrichum costaricense]XP_060385406.1 uncharacterized protein CTAM01_03955 [Colletotrichum tamarilloi]KAK1469441.1 hypothetical protein CMEL01_01208 [Colletotrichum melonis]KAK1504648.1 hypothetical protein CTAM01_03955 [Colletotrichum tamarilloi]KAK1526282.1 hypothetical protein CCOS01_08700 [Colletotrichum costaricense]
MAKGNFDDDNVLDLATLESGHSYWLVETPHDPAPSSQLCLPPAPAPARTPAPAGGVARTLRWDSIGLDEFLAGLTSRHHLTTLDPDIVHQSEGHSTPEGAGVRRRHDSINSDALAIYVMRLPMALINARALISP